MTKRDELELAMSAGLELAMTAGPTPPICPHCGKLMQFVAMNLSVRTPGACDETWRCPDGQWSFLRTIPAPPRYGIERAEHRLAPEDRAPRRRRARPKQKR